MVRKLRATALVGSSLITLAAGCSMLSSKPQPEELSVTAQLSDASTSTTDDAKKRVSNPQAREIRFDGQELVLGGGDCQSIRVDTLREIVGDLKERGRHRSAGETVRLHRRSSSRWVMDSVISADDETIRWVAAILDQGTTTPLHTQLCDAAAENESAAKAFDIARRECMQSLASGSISKKSLDEVSSAANKLNTPLASLEAQRLLALSEIAAGEVEAAAARFTTIAETAADSGAADLSSQARLLASEAHLRAESLSLSAASWHAAVRSQVTAMTQQSLGREGLPPLDTVFWEQVDRLRPHGVQLPGEVALAMNPWKLRIGLGADHSMTPEASLWSAVAACQLTMGQPHLATLSIKRAEVDASDSAKPWLQVALARSVAAQGQVSVATTVLGSLASHEQADVNAAALATLGSIKVQAGAFEQGGVFLIKALSVDGAGDWPGRLAAEADLANVRLIVGELEEARTALHDVQQKLALQGHWQSLVQSLENEAAILELDGDRNSVKAIRRRISEVEREPLQS
ncbi:MAG: hypothetical protein AAGI63_17015 [Planctomycetota bacterium]